MMKKKPALVCRTTITAEHTHVLIWVEPSITVRETHQGWVAEYAEGFVATAVSNLVEAHHIIDTLEDSAHVIVLLEPVGIEGGEDALQLFISELASFYFSEVHFLTELSPDDYMILGKKLGVYNVLVKSELSRLDWLEKEFAWTFRTSNKEKVTLETLIPNVTKQHTMKIANSEDIQTVFQETVALVEAWISEEVAFEIGTTLLEAFTNAVYHGNVNELGEEIFEKGSFVEKLAPHQTVDVCFAMNDESFALSITDQGGSLTPEVVMYWLERNATGEGIFDTSGRGLYLMHALMDRFLIHIIPHQKTQLFLFKEYAVKEEKTPLATLTNKPLLISIDQRQLASTEEEALLLTE